MGWLLYSLMVRDEQGKRMPVAHSATMRRGKRNYRYGFTLGKLYFLAILYQSLSRY